MNSNSKIITITAKMLIPVTLVFGIYVILNGADSVGGGFQGGAVLSVALILRWLSGSGTGNSVKTMRVLEKIFMLCILLFATVLIGRDMSSMQSNNLDRIWLMLINILIGLKVCCGLSIIFYRFVFVEASE